MNFIIQVKFNDNTSIYLRHEDILYNDEDDFMIYLKAQAKRGLARYQRNHKITDH